MAFKIKINGIYYDNVSSVNVNLIFDSIASTFSFDAYFDPENEAHRRLFKPLSYYDVIIYEDDRPILTGTALSHRYMGSPSAVLVPISGYSKTGILSDVSIPIDLYPLEVNNKTLEEICRMLLEPFGIGLIVAGEVKEDASKLYEKSTAKASQSIGDYITELATQRNIILSHDEYGNLLLTRPKKNRASIATYREKMPSTEISLEIDGQGLHSEIATLKQATVGSGIEGESIKTNPLIQAYRPLTKEQTKGDAGDTGKTGESVFGAELQNIRLNIATDRWIWYDGRTVSRLRPGEYITVIAKSCYLSRPTNWFVKEVTLNETPQGRTASLSCVLPESFNGENPKNIFA